MIMIFHLSDWFPKPMIWAIIVKFDQIRKNWWRTSCAEILEVGKNFFAASSVKKMSRFEEVLPEKIKRIAWKFTKTVILLELAGYELIITNEAYGLVGYIYQLISDELLIIVGCWAKNIWEFFRTRSETLNRALINMNWVEVDCYKAFCELMSIAD